MMNSVSQFCRQSTFSPQWIAALFIYLTCVNFYACTVSTTEPELIDCWEGSEYSGAYEAEVDCGECEPNDFGLPNCNYLVSDGYLCSYELYKSTIFWTPEYEEEECPGPQDFFPTDSTCTPIAQFLLELVNCIYYA